MSKLQDIRELAQEHATLVSSSPRDWMGYMDTAARLYRYPFTDQLLIHAQHPQATACASLELWNEKMFRWVNRGARGIALLDENGHNTRLRYVFDISDTHMVAGGRSPYLWQMQEHQQEEILTHLAEAYGLEEKDTGTSVGVALWVKGLNKACLQEQVQAMNIPPFTSSVWPVMYLDSSLNKNLTA